MPCGSSARVPISVPCHRAGHSSIFPVQVSSMFSSCGWARLVSNYNSAASSRERPRSPPCVRPTSASSSNNVRSMVWPVLCSCHWLTMALYSLTELRFSSSCLFTSGERVNPSARMLIKVYAHLRPSEGSPGARRQPLTRKECIRLLQRKGAQMF